MTQSTEAFEKWWGEENKKFHIPRSPKEYTKFVYEAGRLQGKNEGLEEAAQLTVDNPDFCKSSLDGDTYLATAIRRRIKT